MDHLGCFIAGMYALQSKNEWQPEKAKHALKVAREIGKTCHESYIRTGKDFLLCLQTQFIF